MTTEPKFINITPTWESVMPMLFMVLENGTTEGKREAQEELMRLARMVDTLNAKARGDQ